MYYFAFRLQFPILFRIFRVVPFLYKDSLTWSEAITNIQLTGSCWVGCTCIFFLIVFSAGVRSSYGTE